MFLIDYRNIPKKKIKNHHPGNHIVINKKHKHVWKFYYLYYN